MAGEASKPGATVGAQSASQAAGESSGPAPAAAAPVVFTPKAVAPKGKDAGPEVYKPTKEFLVPAVMVSGAVFLSWVAGRYRFSVLYSVIVGSGVAYAIKTLKDRLTRAATQFADRNSARKRVIADVESVEWINNTVHRFWQLYEPILCDQIRAAIEPQLENVRPPGLQGLELGRFTLGKRPPFISSARFLTRDSHGNQIAEDRIILDLGLGFHAPELEVVVAAKLPVGSLPLCVKEIWFQGTMRVELELVPKSPHAKTAIVTFLQPPIVDFSVVPLKTGNIFAVPGIAQLIQGLIINGINDNLVDPEKLVVDLMPPGCGQLEAARGVMFVTVLDAAYKEGSTLPDPTAALSSQEVFAEIKVGKEVMQTLPVSAKGSATTFAFNDTVSLLLKGNLAAQKVQVYLKQKRLNGTRLLGKVYMPAAEIANTPGAALEEHLEFQNGTGFINVRYVYCPMPEVVLKSEDGAEEQAEAAPAVPSTPRGGPSKSGSLLVCVHKAEGLPAKDSNGFSDPFAALYYTGRRVGQTPVVKKCLDPAFDFNKEFSVVDISHTRFTLRVFDKDDLSGDEPMGDLDLNPSEMFAAAGTTHIERQWFSLRRPGPPEEASKAAQGETFGRVQLSLIFREAAVPSGVSSFHADIGNPSDDLTASPYQPGGLLGDAAGAMGKGLAAGVGVLESSVTGAVGKVGSGVGLVGKGASELVNLTGSSGGVMAKRMASLKTPSPSRTPFFSRKSKSPQTPTNAAAAGMASPAHSTTSNASRRSSLRKLFH